jgi:hypothetical protein
VSHAVEVAHERDIEQVPRSKARDGGQKSRRALGNEPLRCGRAEDPRVRPAVAVEVPKDLGLRSIARDVDDRRALGPEYAAAQ